MNSGLRTLLRQAVFRCYGSTKMRPQEIIERCPTMKFMEQEIPCLVCLTKSTNTQQKKFTCEKHLVEVKNTPDWQKSMKTILELETLEKIQE